MLKIKVNQNLLRRYRQIKNSDLNGNLVKSYFNGGQDNLHAREKELFKPESEKTVSSAGAGAGRYKGIIDLLGKQRAANKSRQQ